MIAKIRKKYDRSSTSSGASEGKKAQSKQSIDWKSSDKGKFSDKSISNYRCHNCGETFAVIVLRNRRSRVITVQKKFVCEAMLTELTVIRR